VLVAKTKPAPKKRKAKAKSKVSGPQKRTKTAILHGTDIAGYYYDMEMLSHLE
jgi:hypothetical protein